ncbi:hypothetical protein ILUMI_27466 [Ignelater luminosus]|uniref:Uncharacterized protein n=1 Tax=Ignelater luminosus TaxID=2038154 RepID=A0A8K0C4J1_IGNLU|nr:hypothetical protein ILUMI_27466 [Ignelater luminosus]
MVATDLMSVGIELMCLALAEKFRKLLEKKRKRRPRRWYVKPWIQRREQLVASTQLLVELAAEDAFKTEQTVRANVIEMSPTDENELETVQSMYSEDSETCRLKAMR